MGPEEWRDLGGDDASRPTETKALRIERDAAVARANRAEAQAYDLRLALAREIERERDAAIARAEAAERDLRALRASVSEGRAIMDRLAARFAKDLG